MPFVSIAPRQYQDIFDARDSRKDNEGRAIDWRSSGPKPRFLRFKNTYIDIETVIVAREIPLLYEKLGIDLNTITASK